jgi:divalent metal cation (Fe/Co/Zn/Cd) transporter
MLILYAALEIIRDVATQLLGERITPAMHEKINTIVSDEVPDAAPAHHLHVHRYGDHVEATMHLVLPSGFSLDRAHGVVDRIEARLRNELQIEPTIHVEPDPSGRRTN